MKKIGTETIIKIVLISALVVLTICNVISASSKLNDLRTENTGLQSQLEEANTLNADLMEQLRMSDNELTRAEDTNTQLSADLAHANREIMDMTLEISDLNTKIIDLDEENRYYNEICEYLYNGEWNYDYTDYDIKLLAGVMFGECEDSGRWEQMLVGSVVLNRVLDRKFPNNIHDVVYQFDGGYEQYAPRTKRIAEAVIAGEPISSKDADVRYLPEYYFKLAEILLKYGPVAPEFVVYQAHFNQGNVFWEWEGEEFCYK